MSFDFVKNNPATIAEAGYTFSLTTPDGETHPKVKFTVRGALSPEVRQFGRGLQNQFQMREKAAKARKQDVEDLSPEELDDLGIRSACARLIGWSGVKRDGVDTPYSEAAAKQLMTENPWLREIIVKESESALNFRTK
jgi:hypothetical protein